MIDALRELEPQAVDRVAACGNVAWVMMQPGAEPKYRLCTNKCHHRWCQACRDERKRSAAWKLEDHINDQVRGTLRLLTLTLRSSNTPLSEQIDRLYACFRKFRERTKIKAALAGGIAFLELTHSDRTQLWHPHLHVLFEGAFLPQAVASTTWREITEDSWIIDVRACSSKGAISYVAKYLGKAVPTKAWWSGELLRECIAEMKGRKTHFTFGTWRGLRLSDSPRLDEAWTPVAPLATVICRARQGDEQARAILFSLKKVTNEPLSVDPDHPPPPPLSDLFTGTPF